LTKLQKPIIVVNFKVYREAEGVKALEMAKICQFVSETSGVTIAVCPPAAELGYVARNVRIPVFSQNADPYVPGPATGWMPPSLIKAAGAAGTLVNHSEHKITLNAIADIIRSCKECGLPAVVCADSLKTAVKTAKYCPDAIAVEPPELIGGNISVTDADPGVVENTVKAVKEIDSSISVLCGAGIKTGADVKRALELGADGVLLSSGVVKAKDPRAVLAGLVKYL